MAGALAGRPATPAPAALATGHPLTENHIASTGARQLTRARVVIGPGQGGHGSGGLRRDGDSVRRAAPRSAGCGSRSPGRVPKAGERQGSNRDEFHVDLGCLRECAQVAGIPSEDVVASAARHTTAVSMAAERCRPPPVPGTYCRYADGSPRPGDPACYLSQYATRRTRNAKPRPYYQEITRTMRGAGPKTVSAVPQSAKPTAR